MNSPDKEITVSTFTTYEGLVDHFVQSTGIYFPKMAAGRGEFFRGFSRWLQRSVASRPTSVIAPDPAQGLALPNALQILTSALAQSGKSAGENDAGLLMEKYGLTKRMLTQPVSTLSGGELLLLNYARAEAQSGYVRTLTACNPIFWLNPARHRYWLNLCSHFAAVNRSVEILIMRGDQLDSQAESERFPALDPLTVNLIVDKPLVIFPEIQFPVFHAASRLQYLWKSMSGEIYSPFLLTGDNGIGKSIFARLLAGVYQASSGKVAINAENGSGNVRLLFQEAITQLFAMSPSEYLARAFSASEALLDEAKRLFSDIMQTVCDSADPGNGRVDNSLLAGKACLIAARLAERPALILLDEPGWGLSRLEAGRLVFNTCRLAHSLGTGVGIISHQPEWHAFAASDLKLTKFATEQVEISHEHC